MIKRKSHQIT